MPGAVEESGVSIGLPAPPPAPMALGKIAGGKAARMLSNVAPVPNRAVRGRGRMQNRIRNLSESMSGEDGGEYDNHEEDYNEANDELNASMLSEEEYIEQRQERAKFPEPRVEEKEAKEYCESNYLNKPTPNRCARDVYLSQFWVDYAFYYLDNKKPGCFLSQDFTSAWHNMIEVAGVISLLDLPPTSAEHGYKAAATGRSVELKAASNLIVFKKEVKECKEGIDNNILVAQKYVDVDAVNVHGQTGIVEVKPDEFLINRVYRGQAIITNVSSQKLDCDVLLQIPQNSLPLGKTLYQRSYPLALESYATRKFEYEFYFPNPGKFIHFPVNVSVNSVVVARSQCETVTVLRKKENISEKNFIDVISTGNQELILNFTEENPVGQTDELKLNNLYWMFQDKEFYYKFIGILTKKRVFDSRTWAYSLRHSEREDVIREYLKSATIIKERIGYYFDSNLIKVRAADSSLSHLDYYPVINPRAHKNIHASLSLTQPLILNEQFYNTYKKFILYLIEKPVWNLADKLTLTYYLLLQERVQDALQVFSKVKGEEVEKEKRLNLQYDYMRAYLDFYTGGPKFKLAKEIVKQYLNYPIISWRLLFIDIDQQLKEYDGEQIEELEIDEEERKELAQKKKIVEEAQLDIVLDAKEVVVNYSKISEILVKYYVIDLEVLFSRAPFLATNTEDFSYVQPNSSATIPLKPDLKEYKLKIPDKYSTKNIVIEVNGGGLQKFVTYFSTSLKLQVFENYGELKVTDESDKQLPQVYVKAFIQRKDGKVMFYKDGYTDIRGRFDYVTRNASQIEKASKFALFIMSDTHGSMIKECQPPTIVVQSAEELGPIKASLANYYYRKCAKKKTKY